MILAGNLEQLTLRVQCNNYCDEDVHQMLWEQMEVEHISVMGVS